MTSKSVMWQKGNKQMEWSRADVPKLSKVPNGVWQNTEGLICTVEEACVTFISRAGNAYSFGTVDGMPTLNGWRASSVGERKVSWEKNGKRMDWRLIENVEEVPVLAGTWKNTEGLVCTVKGDRCYFASKGNYRLTMDHGILTLNSWRA